MSHLLTTLFPCFPTPSAIRLPNEKASNQHPSPSTTRPPRLSTTAAASRIVTTITATSSAGLTLDAQITSLVHRARGWSEYLAAKILSALETVLKAGTEELQPVLRGAYDRACEAARGIPGFAAEHPLATGVGCTVVALGVLVVLAPYVLGVLGFGELGPVEGSWAAPWMVRYAGFVPKGSLYAFLQRLGMVWK